MPDDTKNVEPENGSINEPPGSDIKGEGAKPDDRATKKQGKEKSSEEDEEESESDDPDALEEEIEEAEADGDLEHARHRGTPTRTMSHKRSKAKR